jgi:hypothetical protein
LVFAESTIKFGSSVALSGGVNTGIRVGAGAGAAQQDNNAIAIGNLSAYVQYGKAIAIGYNAAHNFQQSEAISIGVGAGLDTQGTYSIAIGSGSGNYFQAANSVAIGAFAAGTNQGANAIGIGSRAGNGYQQTNAIAIGQNAGRESQGQSSIAIGGGAGDSNQAANSIILNATGSILNTSTASSFNVAPIRNDDSQTQALCYNTSTKEITYSTSGTKTFVIEHPLAADKYLVHACLEGPEAGVYYRGTATLAPGENTIDITLPAYVDTLASDFTVHLTPIMTDATDENAFVILVSSRVSKGKFSVYRQKNNNSLPLLQFSYLVFGKRADIVSEPAKAEVEVKGFGPYTWL